METIKDLRAQRGWTQVDLANEVGVTPSTVYKWESGTVVPDIRRLRLLAKAFDVAIENMALVGVDVDRAGNPIIEEPALKIAA
ncbi:MAG: helix-turn-helix transcriptional regulator [Chloroflexia bacterium]|nr:helix-turn-helix transcriptional regulator [Chloroflexia bacterium]